MTRRFRNAVWRELPFSARRALIGAVRTIDLWEARAHRCWRSLVDSLEDSPAWLFVAIVGTIGVVLTILLFLTLTQEALAARLPLGGPRLIESAELNVRAVNEIDSRLCLETTPLKPPPYPAEFEFQGALLADEPVRRPPRMHKVPPPADDFPAWETQPEPPPRRPRETRTVATRPEPMPPDFDAGSPELDWNIAWSHRRQQRHLAGSDITEVSGRSAELDMESRPRLAVLGSNDRDGWSWFRERFERTNIPVAYAGDESAAAKETDNEWDSLSAVDVASAANVALLVQLYAPEQARLQQPGQSHVVIRNAGSDTIRRLQLREATRPLELITAAEPAAALSEGILSRELRNLRRNREQTLALEWFPQSTGRRSVSAEVLSEVLVAAVVQVEKEPAAEIIPEPARPEPPPRREPVVEPVPAPLPEPESTEVIRRPPKRPRPQPPEETIPEPAAPVEVTKPPGLACRVRNESQVTVRSVTELVVDLRNTGDTALADVRIWVTLPPLLVHRHGTRLEYIAGDLPAGQTHAARLRVVGAEPGRAVTRVQAFSAEHVTAEAVSTLDVVAPRTPTSQPACTCGPQLSWVRTGR